MAAAASTVALVATGVMEPQPWQHNTTQFAGSTNKNLRYAIVAITQDTGTYATGGQAVDVLGLLANYGWTAIVYGVSATFTTNLVISRASLNDPNNATAGSRKMLWHLTTTGAELANSTAGTAGTFNMFVVGY